MSNFHARFSYRRAVALLTVVMILTSGLASAQITVSKSILEFSADNLIQDVDVVNSANHRIFLKMSVAQMINPESAEPSRIELDDPRTSPLLVSPTQLMLLPGERKRLRVILRKVPDQRDDVYRLAVRPFVGEIEVGDNNNQKASALKVLLGYDLLVLARPENASAQLDVARTDSSITFMNNGNTNVLLRRITQCSATEEECEELKPNRIYAGERYEVELPKKGDVATYPVQVWHSQGLESYKKVY